MAEEMAKAEGGNGADRMRVAKVFYKHFRPSAVKALDAAMRRLRDVERARDEVAKAYPECAALSYSQVRNLVRMYRLGARGGSDALPTEGPTGADYDRCLEGARCMIAMQRARAVLDDDEFARLLDFGMYLVDKGER